MYICYLDESGTVDPGPNADHFVLLGLAVPADTWKAKDQQVDQLKMKYGLHFSEIHTAWMVRDYQEQKAIPGFEALGWEERRKAVLGVRALNLGRPRTNSQQRELLKNYRKSEAYVHLTRAERQQCVRELADLVGSWDDSRIFCDAHAKAHTKGVDHFREAFEQVVTRFNTYLIVVNGPLGLLVQDNNQSVAGRLTATMRGYHQTGTPWGQINKIVETPMFVDSELTAMVQMADVCAYAARRFFERGETDLFDRIKPRIDRNRGVLVGMRHFTSKYKCKCKVCLGHGRYAL